VSAAILRLALADEAATLAAGARLARALSGIPETSRVPLVVFLSGPLGAGKTTFVRGALRELGIAGAIRSPSYTLVEEYSAAGWDVLHLDLYRLGGADDLAELGLRDRHRGAALFLVEWPERAPGALPADLVLELGIGKDVHPLRGEGRTSQGQRLLASLAEGGE
jgi:tRNA threonylcarbamoyladenosine biosynthesis protein TsaE